MVGNWTLRLPGLKGDRERGERVDEAEGTRERAGGPGRKSPYVTVYVAASLPEAHVIKGKLELDDIPVLLRYESGGTVFGLVGGDLGSVEVQVPRPLVERAHVLLQD